MFSIMTPSQGDGQVFDTNSIRFYLNSFAMCGDAVLVTNGRYELIALSSEGEALFEVCSSDCIGADTTQIFSIPMTRRGLAKDTPIARMRHEHLTPSGRKLSLELNVVPLEDFGLSDTYVFVVRDRTSLVMALEALSGWKEDPSDLSDFSFS